MSAAKERKRKLQQKKNARDLDEGIVIDSDDLISSTEEEEADLLEIEAENASENPLEDAARIKARSMKGSEKEEDRFVTAQEILATIEELFNHEREILQLVYSNGLRRGSMSICADIFFVKYILVTPNKFRPDAKAREGEIAESGDNRPYKDVISSCDRMQQIRAALMDQESSSDFKKRRIGELQNCSISLQDAVNTIIDSNMSSRRGPGFAPTQGVKQRLEKKEGLFRMNLMGKRVNFAARSVISPDPNIETSEIGVPPVFAKKLTYPEPVTNYNFYELKEAVLNGVHKWPGASAVENESGQVVNLRTKNFEERQALANQLLAPSNVAVNGSKNKKVHRHLTNGDIVLMNRQPTLHKPSIMAHRTRILPGEKTIRMHYANCNTYNADFDGDEMNMHFPQNELARAEAFQIANTDNQYLVATSGKPLRGLIQDHISMGVWLTNRDTFFDRDDYYQLLCSCLRPEKGETSTHKLETVIPAIVRPAQRWTGKQVITTVLKNIKPVTHPGLHLQGKSQIAGDKWSDDAEAHVIVDDGELLSGILDKAHLGPSNGGLIHAVHEAYGHTIAGRLLSVLGRLLTKFLHMRAFSCGMDDLRLTKDGERKRSEKMIEADSVGLEVAARYVTLQNISKSTDRELLKRLREVHRDEEKHVGLDNVYNTRTSQLSSDITAACLPSGLVKPFPKNQMQAMTTSGAKGSLVNANFISCNLGQQNLEGRRVPVMASGKTLPSFRPYETNIRAGGYVKNRFLTGIRPQEYFFHAMAGREGLVDTAVKTASSGYLQRCVIKGMEGVKSEYDATVRDTDGSIIQFLYGEDGLDVTKQKHLMDFRFQVENYLSLTQNLRLKDEFPKLLDRGALDWSKRAIKKYNKTRRLDCIDPVLAVFNPNSNIGSTSETFSKALKEYCDANPQGMLKDKHKEKTHGATMSKKTFISLMNVKYLKSTLEAGEAVGVLAGQSIGEPSTQMTLNTFHLAGHAAKNVTLGIPRLREIVMAASKKISTPTMTLHLIDELTEASERFAKGITRLTMAEVMDSVEVKEKIAKGTDRALAKVYTLRLNFYPAAEYCDTYAISIKDVLDTIETRLVRLLSSQIKREMKRKGAARALQALDAQPEVGKSSGRVPEQRANMDAELEDDGEKGNDDDDDGGDEDEAGARGKRNKTRSQAISYDDPDDEEKAIAREARRQTTPDSHDDDDIDSAMGGSPHPVHDNSDSEDGSVSGDELKTLNTTPKQIDERVKDICPAVSQFTFDWKAGQWCEIQLEYDISTPKILLLPILESCCREAVIQSVPNIGACTHTKEKVVDPVTSEVKDESIVLTQGVNLQAMHEYQDILKPHRIFTNDIWQMRCIYGVEAARATIIQEIDSVFKGHSISVDLRHLSLIADYMTRSGGYIPFNRMGLAGSVSPLHKASYETSTAFVRDAVLERDWDELKNPSSRIAMGQLSKVGTGSFDVLNPVHFDIDD